MKNVLVIVGPTASGKSDLAVKLALRLRSGKAKIKGAEIISADSRQVYKGLDAGTGKITKKEMGGIPHHLLNVESPNKKFSIAEYKSLAEEKVEDILQRDKLPIIVGGTGFYIDAITNRASLPEVPPNPSLRKKLEKLSAEKLFAMLKAKDPERAQTIDKHNKVRLVRALEIISALGKVPKLQNKPNKDIKFIWLGLKPLQEKLEKKILKRILKRKLPMIREATKLRASGLSFKRMEELGLEYRYLARLLQKKISKEEFVEQLFTETKKYSKRQMTWFKRNKNIKWFTPNEFKSIEKYARMSLEKGD
jgi:tRNA dimethylallyltransferase